MSKIRRRDAILACKNDINYLRRLCTPQYEDDFPPIYVAIFYIVTRNLDKPEYWLRFVLGLPRGHLKTTFIEILTVWLITFTPLQSFIIIANTKDPHAKGILASIMEHMSSDNYVALFGDWQDSAVINNAYEKEFYLHDKRIRVAASYALGPVRGSKKVERYQVFIIDDAFSREDADSPEQFRKFMVWLNGSLLKGKHAKRAVAIYAGNKYPTKQCVVSKLAAHPAWVSVLVGAIQPDGTALMPNIRSLESLLQEYQDDLDMGLADSFLSEMMNGTASGQLSGVDISKIPPPIGKEEHARLPALPYGRVLILDPATDKDTSDQISIVIIDLYDHGVDICTYIEENKLPHDLLAKHIVELILEHQVPLVCYEDVGFQHIMGREIQNNLDDMGIFECHVKPIKSREAKNTRIRNNLLKFIIPYQDVTVEGVQPTRLRFLEEPYRILLNRLEVFNILKTNNVDDVLDALAYLQIVKNDTELLPLTIIPINSAITQPEAPLISASILG